MPNMHARLWVLRIAQLFTQQLSANDIGEHAKCIGIKNPNELLNCIQNSGTYTVREIVRRICTKEDLSRKSGKETVSKEKRQAIRSECYLIEKLFS